MYSNTNKPPHLVIVGASHAGLAVAASVRKLNSQVTISVLSAESHWPYHRPPLSKQAVFQNPVPLTLLHPENYYAKANIQLHLNTLVTQLDCDNRQLQLKDKPSMAYDLLVLATGSSTHTLPIDGGHLAHSLYSYDDAMALSNGLQEARSIVVIGGGFIGCEFASGARQLGKHTSLLVRGAHLMSQSIALPISQNVAAHHQQQGINIMTQTEVQSITAQGVHIRSPNSTQFIEADLIVAGIGATPNISLAKAAGLQTDQGILVDGKGLTSNDCIYAVGDASQFPLSGWAQPRCLASIQNSNDQGNAIGHNIALRFQESNFAANTLPEGTLNYQPVPWFWSDQGTLKLQMVGSPPQDWMMTEHIVTWNDGGISVLKYADEQLCACDTLNATSQHLAARKLLNMATPITKSKVDKHQGDLKQLYKAIK